MKGTRPAQGPVSKGYIGMSMVLLLGILITIAGYVQGSRGELYVGLLITLAGVLNGVRLLLMRG